MVSALIKIVSVVLTLALARTHCAGLITVDQDGYFRFPNGSLLVPVGVNYWPASAGAEMWQSWPASEIQHDLDLVRSLGFNAIRIFTRWPDFMPTETAVDQSMLQRLDQLLQWCRDRGIVVNVSVFVGWMSGALFWPSWKNGRNLYSDTSMQQASVLFARSVAQVCAKHNATILALEYGNEMNCCTDRASTPTTLGWLQAVNNAFHSGFPGVLVIPGMDHNSVIGDTGWPIIGPTGKVPADVYNVHGYPNPAWNPLAMDGLTDSLTQSMLPFYTAFVRLAGPVLLQEFGTLVTGGKAQQDAYLRAVLPGCWNEGANGFLYWTLRDITARSWPYDKDGVETSLGLVLADDSIKPGLEFFVEFARSMADPKTRPPQPPKPDFATAVGVYVPKHYYQLDDQSNPGNQPRVSAQRLWLAKYLLELAGDASAKGAANATRVVLVRGDQPLPAGLKRLVVPSVWPTLPEVNAIADWVQQGGRLVWHGFSMHCNSPRTVQLLGAAPVDYRNARPRTFTAFGQTWSASQYSEGSFVQVAATTGTVRASTSRGEPAVISNTYGNGKVAFAAAAVEDQVVTASDVADQRDNWAYWYRGMLSLIE